MPTETLEEFLARGGKISKSSKKDISLEELLKNEGLMSEDRAKSIADLISNSISQSFDSELNPPPESP